MIKMLCFLLRDDHTGKYDFVRLNFEELVKEMLGFFLKKM